MVYFLLSLLISPPLFLGLYYNFLLQLQIIVLAYSVFSELEILEKLLNSLFFGYLVLCPHMLLFAPTMGQGVLLRALALPLVLFLLPEKMLKYL